MAFTLIQLTGGLLEEVHSKIISYITTTPDEILLDQQMPKETFLRIRNDHLKTKIKKQLLKLTNFAPADPRNSHRMNLPSLVVIFFDDDFDSLKKRRLREF